MGTDDKLSSTFYNLHPFREAAGLCGDGVATYSSDWSARYKSCVRGLVDPSPPFKMHNHLN